MVHQRQIEIDTTGHGDMHDITDDVAGIVAESGISAGTVHVFNVGSTGAVGCVEFEPGLEADIPAILNTLHAPLPPVRPRTDVA